MFLTEMFITEKFNHQIYGNIKVYVSQLGVDAISCEILVVIVVMVVAVMRPALHALVDIGSMYSYIGTLSSAVSVASIPCGGMKMNTVCLFSLYHLCSQLPKFPLISVVYSEEGVWYL